MTDCLKNKPMKQILFTFLFLICPHTCKIYAQDKEMEGMETIEREKLDLKTFSEMIECYFAYYFEFPKDMETYIEFENSYIRSYPDDLPPDYVKCNIPFFELHKNDIKIERSDTNVVIRWDDWILYKNPNPNEDPCKIGEYLYDCPSCRDNYYVIYRKLSNPRYYDHTGKAIFVIEGLDSLYQKEVYKLREKYLKRGKIMVPEYTFVSTNKTARIYTAFEYQPDSGMSYYCRKEERFESDLLFFKQFENFLKLFCQTYGIARMVFLCPEYTSVRKRIY